MSLGAHSIHPHAGNLPVELTSFVGRRQGLADLKRALASTRLLTLTGAGGVGKTKLALRAGRESARQYPDGVWFVELAPIQDPELVVAGHVHRARPAGPLVELGGLHPERLSGRQTAPPDPRQLRARPRRRGRPGGNAAARLSRRADPRDESAGPRGHRRSGDRCAQPVAARRWSCVAGDAPAIGRCGPVRGARRRRPARLRRRRRERRRDPEHLHAPRWHPAGARAGGGAPQVPWPRRARSWTRRPARGVGHGRPQPVAPAADPRGRDRLELPALERGRAIAVGAAVDLRRRVRARRGAGGLRGRRAGRRDDPRARRVARREVRPEATSRERSTDRFRLLEPLRQFGRERLGRQARRRSFGDVTETGSSSCPTSPVQATPGRSRHSSASVSNEPTSGAPSTSAYRIRPRPSPAPRSARGCGPTGPLKVRPRRSGACTPP